MSRGSGNREIDPLVREYSHDKHRAREAEALEKLKKIASLVKPLMRVRGWKVGTLSEFYPNERNLLGINKNRGQVICLRLRYPEDANQFLPMEAVTDTMLHELSHNVWGKHDANFHALWDELRREYEGLINSGYTGEGFLSKGHLLGGRRVPRVEAQRIRRAAAEQRAALSRGSGQKLGGAGVPVGADMRKIIADAIERRITITKGCGSGGTKNGEEIETISDQAIKSGFRTTAEEDEANDAAIAQALWELHQEDEKEKYGKDYSPPSQTNFSKPTDSSGHSNHQRAKPQPLRNRNVASLSRLIPPVPNQRQGRPAPPAKSHPDSLTFEETFASTSLHKFWTCPQCTFSENPLLHLCCDMCSAEQPDGVHFRSARPVAEKGNATRSGALDLDLGSQTWVCPYCSKVMENRWWTCSTCGNIKLSSKA